MSPEETRGKNIYINGAGTAIFSGSSFPVPASAVPCASCHGLDGRGRAEGGVVPPDIRWSILRARYSDRLLKQVIAMGVGPVMPRYRMSSDDMGALLSYMKKLDGVTDPGVTETTLRIGVLLPPADVLPEVGADVRALMRTWAADTNRAGGIFGRSLEIVFNAPAGDSKTRAAAAGEFIQRERPFALVSSFTDGADAELAALAEELRVPLFATMTTHPQSSVAPNRYVRDLVAGIGEQGRALARFAATRIGTSKRVAVIESQQSSVSSELRSLGFTVTTEEDADIVIFLGNPAALPSAIASARFLLLPASLAHPALFDRRQSPMKVYLSFPIAPENPGAEAMGRYRRLAEHAEVTRRHQVSQFAALSSAQLLVAALECAGREVTREKLLDCVDRVTRLETGFVPPLTYGLNRHIGSTGSFILELQSDEVPVWVDPG